MPSTKTVKERIAELKQQAAEGKRVNPFFLPYDTPHDTVPFDKIRLEDFEEAFMEGIRRDNEQLENIVNNPDKPTFTNTILVPDDDDYYNLLERVSTVFFNLLSAETNDEMDALAQKLSPILTQHANDMRLDQRLFERVKYVHRFHNQLNPLEMKLLDETYQGFVRSGALLNEEGKQRLREITEEASMLSLQFSQNLLKENKAYTLHITDKQKLAGMPDSAIEAAEVAAKEADKQGWLFTLDAPSYGPFMTYCGDRALRKQMYMAKNTVCTHNNTENNFAICARLINLRRELAQLLGYSTYADYVLKRRMAGTKKQVYKLLNDLLFAYTPTAKEEIKVLKDMAMPEITRLSRKNTSSEDANDKDFMPWDLAYYSHKLKKRKFKIDAEMLRPYLELSKVIDGVFGLANKLYGITFKENSDIPVYHPDVKAYEVIDHDGSYLAVLYADFHPRKGKQAGAWMTEYQGQWIERDGTNVRPHVSLVMNLTKPTPDKPALLTLGEVETFLHEFGHALHGIFSNTRFASLSGTNVWWDFVELPSQLMENFAIEHVFINSFARHYQTDEPMPDIYLNRIRRSRNFMCGYNCLRQVSFGLLDMAYYTLSQPFDSDIRLFEQAAWGQAVLLKQLPEACMTVQFSHIMAGGYAAGYYSYKWAEVLEADAFKMFMRSGKITTRGPKRFREFVLSRGGTDHPMTLYKRFRGKEPTIDALLERNGITLGKTETKNTPR